MMMPTSSAKSLPSRHRSETDAAGEIGIRSAIPAASTSAFARGSPRSDDYRIVCESKLYDAYELQDLEQHLDRELSFDDGGRPRSDYSGHDQSQKALLSVSHLRYEHRSSADYLQDLRSRCPCNYCKSNHLKTSISSVMDDSSVRPRTIHRKPSLSTVSNVLIEPAADHLVKGKASCSSSNRPTSSAGMGIIDCGEENLLRARSLVDRSNGSAHLAVQDEAAPQLHANQFPMASSSALKAVKVHEKLRRLKSGTWPLLTSICRSLCYQQNMPIMNEDTDSQSNPINGSKEYCKREYYHHHTIVHYHHVHHHHHHHVGNGVHFEEIDWPLSPARLQELG